MGGHRHHHASTVNCQPTAGPHHTVRLPMEDMYRQGHVSVVEPHGLVLLKCHQGVQKHASGGLVRSARCPKHLKVATRRCG